MNVRELIVCLEEIEDQDLPVVIYQEDEWFEVSSLENTKVDYTTSEPDESLIEAALVIAIT